MFSSHLLTNVFLTNKINTQHRARSLITSVNTKHKHGEYRESQHTTPDTETHTRYHTISSTALGRQLQLWKSVAFSPDWLRQSQLAKTLKDSSSNYKKVLQTLKFDFPMWFYSLHELTHIRSTSYFFLGLIEIPIYISNYSILLFKYRGLSIIMKCLRTLVIQYLYFQTSFLSFNTRQGKVTKETFIFHLKS